MYTPGAHLLIDHYGGVALDDLCALEDALTAAAHAAGAHVLAINMHHFGDNGGVTGVALLAESHISIHTWPEQDYAAIDIFMCGEARPEIAADYLEQALKPREVQVTRVERGQRNHLSQPSR